MTRPAVDVPIQSVMKKSVIAAILALAVVACSALPVPAVQKKAASVKARAASPHATVSRFFTTWLREKDVTAALGFVHPDFFSNRNQFHSAYFGVSEPLKLPLEERQRLLRRTFEGIVPQVDGSSPQRLFSFERLQQPIQETNLKKARKRGIRVINQPLRDGFLLAEIDPGLVAKEPAGNVDWAYLMKTFPSPRYLVSLAVLKSGDEGKGEIPLFLFWAKTPQGWRIIQFDIFGT